MNEIVIKEGDIVFTADGRVGRVNGEMVIAFKDGGEREITREDRENGFADFYMIGRNLFGNKVPEEVMERRIAEQREILRVENEKLDALRKQLWTMRERMVPDWKERMEAKKGKTE